MDLKLDQQKRENKILSAKNETEQKVNILREMEREFELIFGGGDTEKSSRRGKSAASAGRKENFSKGKHGDSTFR